MSGAFRLPENLQDHVDAARLAKPNAEIARLALDCLDLTSLKGDESNTDIQNLCEAAAKHNLASVCIYPQHVKQAAQLLKGTNIRIATVINFPDGIHRTGKSDLINAQTIHEDIAQAITDGATQVDIVFPYGAFLAGATQYAQDAMMAAHKAAGSTPLKIIMETSEFDNFETFRQACLIAAMAGPQALKTSTGKSAPDPQKLEKSALMMAIAAAHAPMGVKISGEVKTEEDCARYITLAQNLMEMDEIKPERFRFGASSLLGRLLDYTAGISQHHAAPPPGLSLDY